MENKDVTTQVVVGVLIAAAIIYIGPAIATMALGSIAMVCYGLILNPHILFLVLACGILWKVTRD